MINWIQRQYYISKLKNKVYNLDPFLLIEVYEEQVILTHIDQGEFHFISNEEGSTYFSLWISQLETTTLKDIYNKIRK